MGLGVQGHRDIGRGACHRHSVPVHPVLILVPCHRAGRQHTPLSQHGQPQKHHPIWCTMRHSPSSPRCPKPLCPAQTGTGEVAVVTASPQTTWTDHALDWRAWSPALASQGGLQHSMSPAGTAQRDKGWGRAAPRTPSYLGLPQPTAGATGSKRLCKGAGDAAEAKNPAKTGRGVQLHPGSILPPHAGGPGQSSPSPSPLHADPTAKG